MSCGVRAGTLERTRERILELVRERGVGDAEIAITAKALTPAQAIGRPERTDYPILKGKERLLEARVLGAKGQAFTDSLSGFSGRLSEVLRMPFTDNRRRALFVAALNALCRALAIADGTVHCKDEEPAACGFMIAAHLLARYGRRRIGLIGFNPSIAKSLVESFGRGNVRISDLDRDVVGKVKFGVKVSSGEKGSKGLIRWSDVLLITGTTLVNGTYDGLALEASRRGKEHMLFGITAAGVCALHGLPRLCFAGRNC